MHLKCPWYDGVEAGQRREQADVGLGDRVADEVALAGEASRQPVEAGEEPVEGALVRLLRAGEPAPVDAVVDVGVDELVDLVDLVAAALGIEVRRAVAGGGPSTRVERSSVICGEVVRDHLPARDVDDRRHGDAPVVVRERERGRPRSRRSKSSTGSRPPGSRSNVQLRSSCVGPHTPIDSTRFEPEQPAHDDRPVRPRARSGDDQPVAAGLDRPAAAAVGRDPIGDVVGVALERATGRTELPAACIVMAGACPVLERHTSFIASLAATATGSHTDENGGA